MALSMPTAIATACLRYMSSEFVFSVLDLLRVRPKKLTLRRPLFRQICTYIYDSVLFVL